MYGDVGTTITPEDFGPLLPVSMYGASKLSAEGLISAFSNLFGICIWIFRPANVIGDRVTHGVIFDFIKKLKSNPQNLTILGDGKQSKSYIYITDVIKAVFLALSKSKQIINLYNIASNTYIKVDEIADMVIRHMKLKNVKITHTSGKIGWPGDVPIVRIANEKLCQLGWQPQYTSSQAVKKTIEVLL